MDLLIKNGKVYTEAGFQDLDVGVKGEKIACLAAPGTIQDARETIDIKGQYVLPGIIDSHDHLREPGYTHKEDLETGTRAAAAGGVTMVCPQPNTNPVLNNEDAYKLELEIAEKKSLVDFNPVACPLQWREGQVAKLAAMGAGLFKIFQKMAAYPYSTSAGTIDTYELLHAFKAVAETGKYCTIHPFDHFFFDHAPEDVKAAGLPMTLPNYLPFIYTEEELAGAAYQLYYLAKRANMRWMALHVWHPGYIDLIRWAKQENIIDVIATCQAMPGGIVGSKEEWEKGYKVYDVTNNKWLYIGGFYQGKVEKTWGAINDGTIDIIDADHAPHLAEEIMNPDPTKAAMGFPILEWYGHLMLNEVNNGNISLERLVEVMSVNQARCFGWYPRKGSTLPGTDADFTICDMDKEWTIKSDKVYTKTQINPHHDKSIKGKVTHTIVRGKIIMRNDEILGEPGYGKFIKPEYPSLKPICCNKK